MFQIAKTELMNLNAIHHMDRLLFSMMMWEPGLDNDQSRDLMISGDVFDHLAVNAFVFACSASSGEAKYAIPYLSLARQYIAERFNHM